VRWDLSILCSLFVRYISKRDCEIDPNHIDKIENLERNREHLLDYAEQLVSRIFPRLNDCPK